MLGGVGSPAASADAQPHSPTAVVESGPIRRVVVATGTIESDRQTEVRSRVPGILERVLVEPGDSVSRGQELVRIERDLLSAYVREAEAAAAAAAAKLDLASRQMERAELLVARGVQASSTASDARSQVRAAGAALRRDEARVARARIELAHTIVRAPIEGQVLDVHVEEGDTVAGVSSVTGGTPIVTLAGTEGVHLRGMVDESDVAWISPGQPATIRTEAFGERRFAGRVRRLVPIGIRVQNVTYFEVEIEIEPEEAALIRPRMSADAEIVAEVVDALRVPETAIFYRGDAAFVEVFDPVTQRFAAREVRTGILEGGAVQLLSGVAAGDQVRLR
jgi:RND family efflux transporter MFP subunit